MQRRESFLMQPNNGCWSYEGANIALAKLQEKCNVKATATFVRILGDRGLEEDYLLEGEEEDIDQLISEFQEWAEQFTEEGERENASIFLF